jgi:hypothetical protein
MENYNIICHIVGLNPDNKIKIIKLLDKLNINLIDLEILNKEIISHPEMNNFYKQYNSNKDNKKDFEKKMTDYWEKNMNKLINDNLCSKKKSIVIGNNLHYKNLSKKININTHNKFFIKPTKQDIKIIIKTNLDNHRDGIISGTYPLQNINYNEILKNKLKLQENYTKNGYILKSYDEVEKLIELLNNKKIKDGIWICLKDSFNINTKIYPDKNGKLYGYTEPIHAILSSFNWEDTELINNNNNITIIEKKSNSLNKLKQKRYLYLVEQGTFIPFEKNNNIKYESLLPVLILKKEEILNVYDKFKYLGLF